MFWSTAIHSEIRPNRCSSAALVNAAFESKSASPVQAASVETELILTIAS
jgi:hypothetical protein